MPEYAFESLVVVDASNSVAGQYAARLFADFGADVILAEPAGGTPTRECPPDAGATSLLFEHLNGGKRAVLAAGIDDVSALASSADVVIVGDEGSAQHLVGRNCPAIVGTVTDFSAHGPYAGWRGSELVHQALSGSMFYTGLSDREPLFGVGRRASYAAGSQLYLGLVAALYQRLTAGGSARRVTVSVHEAAAAMEQNFSTQYGYNGTYPQRGERTRPRGYARCKDGWVVYFARYGQWPEFCEAFGAAELAIDPRFENWGDLVRNWSAANDELHRRASLLTQQQLFEAAHEHKLVLAPMLSLRSIVDEPHLQARDFWTDVDGPTPIALGPVFRPERSAWNRSRPAPGVADGALPNLAARPAASPVDEPTKPLHGVRVLDVTSAWAGPMATRLLASLGADVVKLEGPERPDSWRGEIGRPPSAHPYPDGDGGDRPFDRHAWFNSQNQDKRSVVLDIKSETGLELAQRLVASSDVIVANWSPGALDRAGLGYTTASQINPNVIVVEMPAISSTGPLAMMRGLGPTMEAMSGIGGLIGYPDDLPLGSGSAYLDPTGGLHGTAAALTALYARARTGTGQRVEVAQREAAMQWIGELFLDVIVNDADPSAAGNASPSASPFGAYRTTGDDEWIALDIRDDSEWASFCDVVGIDAEAQVGFVTSADRLVRVDDVDGLVSEHVRKLDKHDLAVRLQRAGVRAAPVQNGRDLFNDPHLRDRAWFTKLTHRYAGTKEYPGLPLEFDGQRSHPTEAAPYFGQHSREILRELADVDDARYDDLERSRVVADRPRSRRAG